MKIRSLLIANRGEIAVRINNTAKRLGIKTYGIKTAREPHALYLKHVDHVVDYSDNVDEIPEFLDIEKIINAAKKNRINPRRNVVPLILNPGFIFISIVN